MSNDSSLSRDLLRQVQTHLQALHGAGINWVYATTTPAVISNMPDNQQPSDPESDPAVANSQPSIGPSSDASSLFGDEPEAGPYAKLNAEERRQTLISLSEVVSGCMKCPELCSTRSHTVFGVGPVAPDLCLVGEAPGAEEDRTGFPFVGQAGQLLTKILVASGFRREDVYICNTLKCRPPQNRTPRSDELENCRTYLEQQIDLVQPKYIVALGSTAAQALLKTTATLGRLRKKLHTFRGTPVMCTYHPAALLRNESWKKDVWEDMKMLLNKMGRPIPQPGSARRSGGG